jgi:hypothetical protein
VQREKKNFNVRKKAAHFPSTRFLERFASEFSRISCDFFQISKSGVRPPAPE